MSKDAITLDKIQEGNNAPEDRAALRHVDGPISERRGLAKEEGLPVCLQ